MTRWRCGERLRRGARAAQAGAPWAVEALYRDLHPSVLAFLRTGRSQEAEDLAADVFVDVAEGLGRFHGTEASFRSWVFTIAYRRLADLWRRAARRRTDPAPPE